MFWTPIYWVLWPILNFADWVYRSTLRSVVFIIAATVTIFVVLHNQQLPHTLLLVRLWLIWQLQRPARKGLSGPASIGIC